MTNDTFTIENILIILQKQLKGIKELERRLIQVDQLLATLKAKESQTNQKLKTLFQKKDSFAKQKTILQKILDESTKSGFVELQPFHLDQLKKIWQKQDPQLFQSFKAEEVKFTSSPKKFYLGTSDRVLRIIFADSNQNYHYQDLNIPKNLTWGV